MRKSVGNMIKKMRVFERVYAPIKLTQWHGL